MGCGRNSAQRWTWDFWAISTHVIVTSLLWYTGLIPDLATLRDRDQHPRRKGRFSVSSRWVGVDRCVIGRITEAAYKIVAGLVLPLILIMQSTVAFEFAVTLVPDWHETRQPLHFVITGAASGLAMVLFVAVLLRQGLGLARYIDDVDIEFIGTAGVGEHPSSLLSSTSKKRCTSMACRAAVPKGAPDKRMFDQFALTYWAAVIFSGRRAAEFFGRHRARVNLAILCACIHERARGAYGSRTASRSWLERSLTGLLLSRSGDYVPTVPEWALLSGTLGLFALFLLLFVRAVPVISLFEARHAEHEEKS